MSVDHYESLGMNSSSYLDTDQENAREPSIVNFQDDDEEFLTSTRKKWQVNDEKAVKSGPHHTIYWAKATKNDRAASSNNSSKKKGQYGLSVKYTGDWNKDKKNGFGCQEWSKGHKYEGEWTDGKRHGKGTFWVKRGKKLQKQYTGDWENDKRQGLGVFFYENGGKYEGFWEKNLRIGRGRMTYSDGSVYEGDWEDDKRSGFGSLLLPNSNRYEGHWQFDKKEGPGRYFYVSTSKVYEGEWHNDIAKCGEYKDMTSESSDSRENFSLPQLELSAPESVLGEAIASVRQLRAMHHNIEDNEGVKAVIFSDHDINVLKHIFSNVDQESATPKGTIRCADLVNVLSEFGLDIAEDNINELFMQINVSYDTEITFAETVDIISLLAE